MTYVLHTSSKESSNFTVTDDEDEVPKANQHPPQVLELGVHIIIQPHTLVYLKNWFLTNIIENSLEAAGVALEDMENHSDLFLVECEKSKKLSVTCAENDS